MPSNWKGENGNQWNERKRGRNGEAGGCWKKRTRHGREREGPAGLRKLHRQSTEGRKEAGTRFIGFALHPEFYPLHLHFGDTTLKKNFRKLFAF